MPQDKKQQNTPVFSLPQDGNTGTPTFSVNTGPEFQQPNLGQVQGYGGSVLQDLTNSFVPDVVKNHGTPSKSILHSAVSTISPVLDVLSRPNYAIARFFDSDADTSKSIIQNLQDSWDEFVDPKLRLSFSDVIAKRNPRYAKDNPTSTMMLGFLADVAFDPMTYLGAGLAKSGLQIGGRTLSKAGLQALEIGQKVTSKQRFVADNLGMILEVLNVEGRQAARTGQKSFSPAGQSLLKDAGYFEKLDERIEEITKQFGGKTSKAEATSIAQKEIYQDLTFQYRNALNADEYLDIKKVIKEKELNDPLPNLFKYLSTDVSPKGKAGISNEAFHPNSPVARFVYRNKEGSPIGILELNLDTEWKGGDLISNQTVTNANLAVNTLKKDVAINLFSAAKDAGFIIDPRNINGLTKRGLKFVDKQVDDHYSNLIGMSKSEVRERVEQRISRIAAMTGDSFKSFEVSGLRLKVGLPFGKQYDIPGTAKVFNALGINALGRNIASLASKIPGAKTTNRVFNKYAEFDTLPPEFVDEFRNIENTFDNNAASVVRDVRKMGQKISLDRRQHIQETMYNIDDATRIAEEQLGRTVTIQEAAKIKTDTLNAAKLKPEEFALVSSMYTGYAKMSELEIRSNLLHTSLANYAHREYEVLKDPTRVVNAMSPPKANAGTSTFLGSSQARDYITLTEARAAGNVPEMDALIVYAQRMLKHREKMAVAHFNDTVRTVFGLGGEYGKQLTPKEFAKLPQVVQTSIKSLGDAVYPSTMNNEIKNVLKVMDTGLSWWKRGAYSIKPASGVKQGISNTIQAAMIAGVKSFKSFDPRAVADTALMLFDRGKPTKQLPAFVNNLLSGEFGGDAVLAARLAMERVTGVERASDYAAQMIIKNPMGVERTGTELVDVMLKQGVIKGFDASGETLKIKINNQLKYNPDSIGNVAGHLIRPWAWPAFAEDYGRAMLFMNGIRMGYSDTEAIKLVNKALFDYSRGLSYTEKNVFKRLIPFYTYQRFAIPFVLKNVATQPGNAVTADKVVKLMDKLFSGTTLTPAEQDTFGSTFLVDQPRVFTGFDKDGKAGFNVLNNLTPFDTLNLFAHDKDGNIDYKRSAEKTVLAALTPYLKIPLEVVLDKQFFSNRSIKQGGRLGNQKNTGIILDAIPGFVKSSMGWENRVNQQTGETSVYINPYLAYSMTSFVPGLKSYINMGDEDKSALERSMELITGISKVKMDLKQQHHINSLNDKKELMQLKGSIRSATRRGSQSQYDTSRQEYLDFMNLVQQRRSLPGEIRGEGLTSPEQTPTNPVQTQNFK